ncbi:MAG: hypothetical protein KC418_23075 [Anaerolineales bacterium]|nr:hypothetical protein [Anaerolineales bacterium]MCB8954491.1 hypothetical protein [Ardenticatenales bacterium]
MPDNQPAAREAMMHQYLFLALSLETIAGTEKMPAPSWRTRVQEVLEYQSAWLGQDATALPTIDLLHSETDKVQLYPPGGQAARWQPGADAYAAFAFVQAEGDAVTLHLACGHAETAQPDAWTRLQEGSWPVAEPLRHDRFYLGQTICFAARVVAETDARRLAEDLLPGVGGDLRLASLPWGGWLYDRVGLSDQLALFYPDDDLSEQAATRFLNEILPRLSLLTHKVSHQYSRTYWQLLRPQLIQQEQNLSQVLLRTRAPGQDLAELENQLQDIATAYGQYAVELGQFARAVQGVNVNAANLQNEVGRAALPLAGVLLAWQQGLAVAVAQMQADKAFYQATIQEAEVTLRTLQIQVDLLRGQLEAEENRLAERRNWWLAVIGVLLTLGEFIDREVAYSAMCGVVNALGRMCDPADTVPGWALSLIRVGIILGIALLVWGGSQLWRRNKL